MDEEQKQTVRAKFRCVEESRVHWGTDAQGKPIVAYSYRFGAVTSGSKENERFWKSTPSGELKLTSVLQGQFEVGKEYYLDFSPAPVE